ncbi:type IV pilus modification protein PilV [Psychrobacter sp. I-STPA10]|uniref:type IV pilus modification protein PilV n=1 Tax=Psychrobacter sp. I-STPA10 TaxID=2585769 RepID=UPI0022A89B1E|nr:type IV pilus modification protein PilV [Psychrobacter sp. I-STPA10]
MNNRYQQGLGLVEVMVSLLLLAIAVLGFAALQMRAVSATDEGLVRSRAASIVASLSEAMRDNMDHLDEMKSVFDSSSASVVNCLDNDTVCNPETMAKYAAKEVKNRATAEDFKVNMVICPGTASAQKLYCAVVAWGDTEAALGSSSSACADSHGIYNKGSSCLIMETY